MHHVRKIGGHATEHIEVDFNVCQTDEGKEVLTVEEQTSPEPFPCVLEKPTDIDVMDHLPPDHPLLARFQQTLKEHLLDIKTRLGEDIDIIKHQIKLKANEREEFGLKLYNLQEEIDKQNKNLEDYSENIRCTVIKRIEDEQQCKKLREQYDEKNRETNDRRFRYNQHIVELRHLQDLENNIRQWSSEFEDQLITSKRVVSKDQQLQRLNADEKHKIDLMSFHLETEMNKREDELKNLTEQLGEQNRTIEILRRSVADANIDLETLQLEHKRLTQAWGEVIVALKHRDRVLFQARESLDKQFESLKLTRSAIDITKNQTAKMTDENCKLRAFKQRLENDRKTINKDTKKNEKILAKLEAKMEELPVIIEQTEKDYQEAKRENNQLQAQLNSLQYKIDRLNVIKAKIEDEILKLAQDQIMCEKADEYHIKLLGLKQESRRGMEMNLNKVTKQISKMLLKLERQKGIVRQVQEEGEHINRKMDELDEESNIVQQAIRDVEVQINLTVKQIERMSNQFNQMLKDREGCETNPTDFKILTAQKMIADVEQKVQEHQQFWLMLQNHIVHLHEKRNLQLNEIQMSEKQMMIMGQKSLKINIDLEKTESSARTINREIQNCSTKLELLSAKCFEKNQEHELIEFDCNMEHAELLNKLRDNEMRVLALEQETADLQSEIGCHKEQVLELHREALSWETKYKLLDDTIRWRRKESAIESEIGVMRANIHHLQVRYKELRHAQERLVHDLDNSVMHREHIFVRASTRQKVGGLLNRACSNVEQRVNDVKSKLKQVHYEIIHAERNLTDLAHVYCDVNAINLEIKKQIKDKIESDKQVINEIEQSILEKHKNLGNIVRTQTRAKQFRRLVGMTSSGRTSKSEESIDSGWKKVTGINHQLIDVIETLLHDFPQKSFALKRIMYTLQD